MVQCVYLLYCFSELLRYMEKFERKYDMDMGLRRSRRIRDRMMLTLKNFIQQRVHKLHPVYNIHRRRLQFLFKRHLVILCSSIIIYFEDFVGRTTRKQRLRCLYAKYPERLSRLYDLRRELFELYTQLTVKIGQQPFPPFYRLIKMVLSLLREGNDLDQLLDTVRDPEHGL